MASAFVDFWPSKKIQRAGGSVVHPQQPRLDEPYNNDVPCRFELFLLGDGEKKVTYATETRKHLFPRHLRF